MDLTERGQLTRWLSAQLLLTLVHSFVVALIVRWVLVSFGHDASVPATWAVSLVAVAALRLQRLALPGTGARKRRRREAVRGSGAQARAEAAADSALGTRATEPVAPLPETLDRRFRRLARHTDRITYAVVEPRHYHSGVRPVLREITADRLRRHYGIDMAADPEQARQVMGEDLWQALTTDRQQPPTTADLGRWLTTLEALDDDSPALTARLRPS